MKKELYGLLLLLVVLFILSNFWTKKITDNSLNKLMVVSGLNKQVSKLPEFVCAYTEQVKQQGLKITDAEFGALQRKIQNAFQPSEFLRTIAIEVKNNISESEAKDLFDWYESDLGMRINKAEENPSTPTTYQEMMKESQCLLTDKKRVKLVKKIADLVNATDSQIQYLAVLNAVLMVVIEGRCNNIEFFKRKLTSQRAEIERIMIISLIYNYKDIDTDSIEKYIKFLEYPATMKFYESVHKGFQNAYNQSIDKMAKSLYKEYRLPEPVSKSIVKRSVEKKTPILENGKFKTQNNKINKATIPQKNDRTIISTPVQNQSELILRYSFDEEGGTIQDHSGHGNTAHAYGAVCCADGKQNCAYEFNGRDAYMQTSRDIDLSPPYTVTAWVYLRTLQKDTANFAAYRGRTILSRGNLNYSGAWDYIFNVNAYGKLGFVTHSSFSRADSLQNPVVFPLNQWVFVAFTHKGDMGLLYQDGRLVRRRANMNAGDKHRTRGTFIGKIFNSHPASHGDHFWDGKIDELRVYKKALTEQELAAIQHENANKFIASPECICTTSQPVFHLSFDDGTCKDVSGHNHNGTGHGVQTVSNAVKKKGMKLDGLKSYISVEQNQDMSLDPSDNRSILLWWKTELLDEQTQALLSMRGRGNSQRGLSVDLFKGKYYRVHLQFYHHADFPAPLQAHRWNHLAVVKRGTNWTVYHNGIPLTNPITKGWPFTAPANAQVPLWIGRDHAGNNPFFGTLDEVMFFNRALSASEVKQIYTAGGVVDEE